MTSLDESFFRDPSKDQEWTEDQWLKFFTRLEDPMEGVTGTIGGQSRVCERCGAHKDYHPPMWFCLACTTTDTGRKAAKAVRERQDQRIEALLLGKSARQIITDDPQAQDQPPIPGNPPPAG